MLLAAKLQVFSVRDNLVISASTADPAVADVLVVLLASCCRDNSNSTNNKMPATAVGSNWRER